VSGNLLLQKFVGGAENDELQSIINTNDNFLATVGYTESRGEINGDGYFLKLNLNADTIFTTTFGGPYKDYACDLVQKDAGQGDAYYLGGAMTPSANAKTHSYMYRISPTGTFLSAADEFRNADNEEFISVANSKHHSYLTAFVRSTIVGGKSMQEEIFIAYVTGFSFLVNDGGYFDHEYVYSVEATRDKGYITVGSTDGYGSVGKDILFIKRDSAVVNYETITSIPLLTLRQSPIISYQDESIIIDPNRDDLEQIEICDMMGNKIFNQITSQKQYRIDISTYPHSIYIVTIKYKNGGIYSEKFIH